ncbi:MAG: TonB-dependent receptor, partial [Novosphingobium sp.]
EKNPADVAALSALPYTQDGFGPTLEDVRKGLIKSDLYGVTEFTNAFSAQLNSAWTDKFSTELRASYKFYRRGQEAYSGPDYAQFNVCLDPTSNALGAAIVASETICSSGSPIVRMGPDTPRQANKFSNKILTIQANATLRAGSHTFKLEYDNMHSSLYNLFVFGTVGLAGTGGPQGLYYFDSFADFGSAKANELVLNSTTTGNKNDGFVRWGYTIHTVGLQDTWHAAPNLTVNAGLRYDFYSADRSIGLNTNFVNRFSNLYPGLTNISTLNGKSKLQPRVGFNWAPTSNLRIAGGFGLFAGGLSDVFISNNYSNTGTSLNSTGAAITGIDLVRINGGCIDRSTGNSTTNGTLSPAICAALDNVNGATPNAAALAYLQNNTGVLANATTNSLDPKFKLPAQWKYNLSLNWKPDFSEMGLGSGWTVRGDVLFSDAQQAIRWIDLRAQPLIIGGVAQTTPDGRIRYGGAINAGTGTIQPGGNSDIQLTNTTAGRARVFAVGLDKEFGFGHVAVGYTHQNVTDVAGALVSSTVGSSYGVPTSSPNSGGDVGRSAFEVRSTYRASLDLHHKFFGDNETRFGVSWALRSGVPFSALMFDSSSNSVSGRAAVFGTINTSSHLLYVPDFSLTAVTNASTTQGTAGTLTQYGNVVFADAATLASVQALVNGTALKNYQGKIAPKNLLTGPSYSKIDLNFAQEFPFFMRSKITALFSIENFLNLLNREWGSYQEIGNTSVIRVACQTAAAGNAQACPAYIYSSYSAPKTTTYPKASLWTIRAGVRLSF